MESQRVVSGWKHFALARLEVKPEDLCGVDLWSPQKDSMERAAPSK